MDNDSIATPHGLRGCRDDPCINANTIDHCDSGSGSLQMFDETLLMQRAALRKRFEDRVPDLWLRELAMRDLEIKLSQVMAIQVADQVARAELKCFAHSLHVLTSMLASEAGELQAACDLAYGIDFRGVLPNP
ncbi:hypothetical protein [Bradyrhizobium sp. RDI18]|uniref:hypothetical protein n=1 Tax=Bradyrhizobium sp. RDI18 TaxID=3367400 RepID=UPI00370F8AB2